MHQKLGMGEKIQLVIGLNAVASPQSPEMTLGQSEVKYLFRMRNTKTRLIRSRGDRLHISHLPNARDLWQC